MIVCGLCVIGIYMNFVSCTSGDQSKLLNMDIEPIDYKIHLTPYLDDNIPGKLPFTFDGICTIAIKPSQMNLDTITVHKVDLIIHDVSVTKEVGLFPQIDVKHTEYNNATEKFVIKLAKSLAKDETFNVIFNYTGNLRDDMTGFYRSSYEDGNQTK